MHDINHKGIMPDVAVTLTDDDERKMTSYLDTHPEDSLDVKDDRQLQVGDSFLAKKLKSGDKPHGW
jgi:C-terminal processing protease CtpA/Prc